jgi:hypothetical protein
MRKLLFCLLILALPIVASSDWYDFDFSQITSNDIPNANADSNAYSFLRVSCPPAVPIPSGALLLGGGLLYLIARTRKD